MTLLILIGCAVAAFIIYKRATKEDNNGTGTGTGSGGETTGGDSPNEVQE